MIKSEDLVPGDRCVVRSSVEKFFGEIEEAEAIFIESNPTLMGGIFLFEGFGKMYVYDIEIKSIVKKFERK